MELDEFEKYLRKKYTRSVTTTGGEVAQFWPTLEYPTVVFPLSDGFSGPYYAADMRDIFARALAKMIREEYADVVEALKELATAILAAEPYWFGQDTVEIPRVEFDGWRELATRVIEKGGK